MKTIEYYEKKLADSGISCPKITSWSLVREPLMTTIRGDILSMESILTVSGVAIVDGARNFTFKCVFAEVEELV